MLDIEEFGKYRAGLTTEEIKEYLVIRYNELLSYRGRPIKKINKATYNKFCESAGCNTCAVITVNKKQVYLMYRHDVLRFTEQLFNGTPTYWD